MTKYIYLISTLDANSIHDLFNLPAIETVGVNLSLRKAISIVRKNAFDINDGGYYKYAIIEKFECSIYPSRVDSFWFEWNPELMKYRRIKTPAVMYPSWQDRAIIG